VTLQLMPITHKEGSAKMEKITWKCPKCGYTFDADASEAPPETCKMCKEKCQFVNVTCYIPECGMTGQDTRLG
jgi:rubredoxin